MAEEALRFANRAGPSLEAVEETLDRLKDELEESREISDALSAHQLGDLESDADALAELEALVRDDAQFDHPTSTTTTDLDALATALAAVDLATTTQEVPRADTQRPKALGRTTRAGDHNCAC